MLEEGIVKSGERHVEQGVGVRVQTGERQGYAHSDEITPESLALAAKTARAISESSAPPGAVAVRSQRRRARSLPGRDGADRRADRVEDPAARARWTSTRAAATRASSR